MTRNTLLITGGTGFIGSHTAVACVKFWPGRILVVDNFRNSHESVGNTLESLSPNIKVQTCDLMDYRQVNALFMQHHITAVIHFAALKSVEESVAKPLLYYSHNLNMLLHVCQAMVDHNVKNLVFSSSACVYSKSSNSLGTGYSNSTGYSKSNSSERDHKNGFEEEDFQVGNAVCPYGQTKRMGERILYDLSQAHPEMSITVLRYFNPLGALTLNGTKVTNDWLKDPKHAKMPVLGENPKGQPKNIMPILLRALHEQRPFYIYGDDYDTADGTCERDYIHVMDVAEGHVAALRHAKPGLVTCNLGTGQPTSVQNLLCRVNQLTTGRIEVQTAARRPGDSARVFADATWAEALWGWVPRRSLDTMLVDSLNWANRAQTQVVQSAKSAPADTCASLPQSAPNATASTTAP